MARFCCMGAKRGEWKEKTKYQCNERRWEWLVDVWSRINWQNVLRHKLGVDDTAIYSAMQRNRIRWYGHVLRKDDEEWVNNLCTTFEGRTKRKNISLILTEYRLLSSQSNGCVLFGCFRRVHDHISTKAVTIVFTRSHDCCIWRREMPTAMLNPVFAIFSSDHAMISNSKYTYADGAADRWAR